MTRQELELSNSKASKGRSATRSKTSKVSPRVASVHMSNRNDSSFALVSQSEAKFSTQICTHEALRGQEPMGDQEEKDTSQSSLKDRGDHRIWRRCEVTVEVEYPDKSVKHRQARDDVEHES